MRGRRGSVLVLALWVLLVLGFLAVAVGGRVAANIRAARSLQQDLTAYRLARAGVELAIAEVVQNPTNFDDAAASPPETVEALFHDNASLAGGTFSVFYTFDDTNRASIVTNYGVTRLKQRIDIDRADKTDWERLENVLGWLGASADLATGILSNYPAQKTVAREQANGYGPYEALPELLAVDGMDGALYEALERLVTIRQFERRYPPGSSDAWERRASYGGVAEGRAVVKDANGAPVVTASRRIMFVYDTVTTNLLYWREH